MQLGQATSQLCQRTGIDSVKDCFWLSTGQSRLVAISSGGNRNDRAPYGSDSGETIDVEGGQNLFVVAVKAKSTQETCWTLGGHWLQRSL